MDGLRWVLLGLGAIVMLAIYAWGTGYFQRFLSTFGKPRYLEPNQQERPDPSIDGSQEPAAPGLDSAATKARSESGDDSQTVDRVITVRCIPHGEHFSSDKVILALRTAGLRHGRYGIFHMFADESSQDPMFSVANLTEPGSFDLNKLAETKIPGMSFFLVLPGIGDPIKRFDRMVEVARSLARSLEADLHDEKGSSWSVQRERYVREEIIEYRHQMDRRADFQ